MENPAQCIGTPRALSRRSSQAQWYIQAQGRGLDLLLGQDSSEDEQHFHTRHGHSSFGEHILRSMPRVFNKTNGCPMNERDCEQRENFILHNDPALKG